ncbi:MAG: D-aminoacyl-tRNA deacylase [Microthrixaceae bacterium]
MRALVQRVSGAAVDLPAEDLRVGGIGPGLLALVGVTHEDSAEQAARLAGKIWNLRVFPDDSGDMNGSLADRHGGGATASVLVVSQFTLYGDTRKGRRPSFVAAARPEHAQPLVELLVAELSRLGATTATGRFGAHMAVSLVNDGPVTLLLEV